MADIELVIELDKDIVRGIIEGENDAPRNIVRAFQATIACAIQNGVILPKGHGRLIDADKLANEIYVIDSYSEDAVIEQIKDVPTIIDADKE